MNDRRRVKPPGRSVRLLFSVFLLIATSGVVPAWASDPTGSPVAATVVTTLSTAADQVRQFAFDANPDTAFASAGKPRASDHFTLVFDQPVAVRSIEVATGQPDGTDALDAGILEISADGKAFGEPSKFVGGRVHVKPSGGVKGAGATLAFWLLTPLNSNGGIRNPKAFWREWAKQYGDTLSDANKAAIKAGRSPVVDDEWLKAFPEHAPFKDETIIHHHLDYGPTAIPLPETVHSRQPGWGIWHPDHAGGP